MLGEALGLGAGGGVTARGGVVGARAVRRGVACRSIGNAMKTSLPVGWSRDNDRLMELAVMGAGAIDDEVERARGEVGGLMGSAFGLRFRMTTSHRISSSSARESLHTTSTSYCPVPSLSDRRLDETIPISPSSDSVDVDVSADELLTSR